MVRIGDPFFVDFVAEEAPELAWLGALLLLSYILIHLYKHYKSRLLNERMDSKKEISTHHGE